jgi:hypothetical protein
MAATKADAKAEPTGGGGGSFTEERLSDKLDKLSSSAASIQSILLSIYFGTYFTAR